MSSERVHNAFLGDSIFKESKPGTGHYYSLPMEIGEFRPRVSMTSLRRRVLASPRQLRGQIRMSILTNLPNMAGAKAPSGLPDPFVPSPEPFLTPAPPTRPSAVPKIPVQDHLADELGTEMVEPVKAPIFEDIFKAWFQDGPMLQATFPEDESFKFLIGWIYKGTIEIPQDKVTSASGGFARSQQLVMLFILAEKLNISRLSDEAMDFLTKFCKAHQILPNPTPLSMAYNEVRAGSKLRVWTTRFSSNKALEKILGENRGLLADVIAEFRVSGGKAHSMLDMYPECDYHQHAVNEICPYLKRMATKRSMQGFVKWMTSGI
ncbi:uncharacterized protein PAC_16662 [Phialocephala subalpina]|uniref:BTB domain-containing protein n=1 Tax=Phialocephala subalpina TaxID=576137 RepID=A0A1L7XNX9_9HELO|nr:uncharacterized protein PAC_16662 [Phialocephala subalpina]